MLDANAVGSSDRGEILSETKDVHWMKTSETKSETPVPNPKRPYLNFGPALLVTAAFIGPGTVTAASIAGADYGFSLIWAVAFSVLATIVLQEMTARLGIISGKGLANAIKESIQQPIGRTLALTLILGAILFGNSAYQTGNLVGATAGLSELHLLATKNPVKTTDTKSTSRDESSLDTDSNPTPAPSPTWIKNGGVILFAIVALGFIWIGRLDLVSFLMTGLVSVMSIMFVYTAIRVGPDWAKVVQGLIPSVPPAEDRPKMILFIIGLIGTTVVPYNLFLHASSAAEKWHDPHDDENGQRKTLRSSYLDTVFSVLIGGVVTASILITMAVAFDGSETKLLKLAQVGQQLQETSGTPARILFAIGLCAAGLSSAIAAPIAAAYATAGCFQWPAKLSDPRLKLVATSVVLVGVGFGTLSSGSPEEIIIIAQVANGLLLPLVAIFLLYVANQQKLLGKFRNGIVGNVFAGTVILITLALASRQFISVFNKLTAYFSGN
jgi:Mn2+/Fe2+ NRAMP family transporter